MNERKLWRLKRDEVIGKAGEVKEADEYGTLYFIIDGFQVPMRPMRHPEAFEVVCVECRLPPCKTLAKHGACIATTATDACHGHAAPAEEQACRECGTRHAPSCSPLPPLPYPMDEHGYSHAMLDSGYPYSATFLFHSREHADQFETIAELAYRVMLNRINRDARPLKDGEECYFVTARGFTQGTTHDSRLVLPEENWRTREEATDYAALLAELLCGDKSPQAATPRHGKDGGR